jgi:class 3 adenylate cyclase
MEPQIRYARTSDGVSIAFTVLGDGPIVVEASQVWGSLHAIQTGVLGRREWAARLVELGRGVASYDARGTGSSDRNVDDFSLTARVKDLEAVVDQLGVERFPLAAQLQGAPAAIEFTIRHPERVSHLILTNPFASGAAYYASIPAMGLAKAMREMAEDQWEFFTQSLASAVIGFRDIGEAQALAAMFRASMSPSAFVAWRDEAEKIDITARLPMVSVPTLVIHDQSLAVSNASLARTVAAGIPDARFVVTVDTATAASEFIGGKTAMQGPGSGTAIILFADIADSTALTERLGDAAFREKARALDEALRRIIAENGGAAIDGKLVGDGVLATFPAASQAIAAALAYGAAAEASRLGLHVGLHAGDVLREDNNVYGGAVNIASRISALAAPGEVLVSDIVRGLARTSAGVTFEDRGEHSLKGVADPQRVFAVRAAEAD